MTKGMNNNESAPTNVIPTHRTPSSPSATSSPIIFTPDSEHSPNAMPQASVSPDSTMSLFFQMSDLVNDTPTGMTPLPFTGLQNSKHNPDFRVRNQAKMLELATILCDLHLHVQAAHRTEDQPKLDALHARILKLRVDLKSVAHDSPVAKVGEHAESSDEGFGHIISANRESEWYTVKHGSQAEEGDQHEALCRGRVEAARKRYEAKLDAELSGDDSDDEASVSAEHESQDESDETLVNDEGEDLQLSQHALRSQAMPSMTLTVSALGAALQQPTLQQQSAEQQQLDSTTVNCKQLELRMPTLQIGQPTFEQQVAEQQRLDSIAINYHELQLIVLSLQMAKLAFTRKEILGRSADFLETLQQGNAAVMSAHGLTLADLDEEFAEIDNELLETVENTADQLDALVKGNNSLVTLYGLNAADLLNQDDDEKVGVE